MNASALTTAYSIAFAIWLSTVRYASISIGYMNSAMGIAESILTFVILVSTLLMLSMLAKNGWRTRRFPIEIMVFVVAVLCAELFWRSGAIYKLISTGFKLVSIAVWVAQPLIAALGVASVIALRRSLAPKAQ